MDAEREDPNPRPLGPFLTVVRGGRLAAHVLVGFGVLFLLPVVKARAGRLAGWWYRRFLRILGVAVHFRGEQPPARCLIAANHVSWLDIIVLGGLLDAVFVSKAEISGWPVVGRFARHTGTVFLPRGAGQTREATRRLTTALSAGRSVVLFPEATTNEALLPGRFHPRLFAAAIEAEVPVQPVAVHYLPASGATGRHHALAPWVDNGTLAQHFARLFRLPRLQVEVKFCPLLPPAGQQRRSLSMASHDAVTDALGGNRRNTPEADADRSEDNTARAEV